MSTIAHYRSSGSVVSQSNISSNQLGLTSGLAPSIELYTSPGCAYCLAAKKILTHKNFHFVEFNTARDYRRLAMMRARAPGRTFPQVVINQQWIGGFDDLLASDLIQSA